VSADDTLVFVYGTLKRGALNHHVLAGETFVGEARTEPGYRLYHLGEYPGMVAAAADRHGVGGEVWRVSPAALARLDAFEGTGEGLYRRDRVRLLPPFAEEAVETYLYLLPVGERPLIPSGYWPS